MNSLVQKSSNRRISFKIIGLKRVDPNNLVNIRLVILDLRSISVKRVLSSVSVSLLNRNFVLCVKINIFVYFSTAAVCSGLGISTGRQISFLSVWRNRLKGRYI